MYKGTFLTIICLLGLFIPIQAQWLSEVMADDVLITFNKIEKDSISIEVTNFREDTIYFSPINYSVGFRLNKLDSSCSVQISFTPDADYHTKTMLRAVQSGDSLIKTFPTGDLSLCRNVQLAFDMSYLSTESFSRGLVGELPKGDLNAGSGFFVDVGDNISFQTYIKLD